MSRYIFLHILTRIFAFIITSVFVAKVVDFEGTAEVQIKVNIYKCVVFLFVNLATAEGCLQAAFYLQSVDCPASVSGPGFCPAGAIPQMAPDV